LTGADLSGANLPDSELDGTDLSGANLTGANLENTYLFDCDLDGANVTNATLTRVGSGGIQGTPLALPVGWQLIEGCLVGPGANLQDASLQSSDLRGVDLSGANLYAADLSDTDLTGANLTNADLGGANLHEADLTDVTLTNVISGLTHGTPLALPTGWALIGGYLVGPGANLGGAYLDGADLTTADLKGANLEYAVLTNADLSNADLSESDLTGSDLTGSILAGVHFSPAVAPVAANLNAGIAARDAQIAALQAELAGKYSLDEIADLRPGSVLIEVVNGQAELSMKVQVSTNMVDWTDTAETSTATIPVPDAGRKFFRFAR
jgi:uncharacterized protein YjbI with pentapeptide repeats